MALGTVINTGTGSLVVNLRDGAGKTNSAGGAVTLQTVAAGTVSVTNSGTTAGSDVIVGPVTSSGTQTYLNPNGTTVIAGNLVATGSSNINFFNSVTLSAGAAVTANQVNFAGSGTQVLQSGPGASFANLNETGGGTLRLASSVNIAGNFTFNISTGVLDATNQQLSVGGNWNWLTGFFLSAGSTVNLGGVTQTVHSGGRAFNNLTLAGAVSVGLQDALTVTGDFTNFGTAFDASNRTVTVGGNWTWFGFGTLTSTGSIVLFNGVGTQVLSSGGQAFNQLLHTGGGTLVLADSLAVGGNFTNSAGTFDTNGQAVSVTGSATISGGVVIAAALTVSKDLTVSGAATLQGGSAAITVAKNFNLASGSFVAPSATLSVGGSFIITAGSFDPNGGTVTLNGTGGQSLNSGEQAFNNLVHAGGGTLRLDNSDLTVNGTFSNSSGNFDANGQAVTVWGLMTIDNGTSYLGGSASQYFGGGLNMPAGGSLDGSNLTLGGDVTAGQGGPGNPATITGSLSLDGATRTFTIAAGADTSQLLISAVISGSPGVGLTKAGAGTLRLLGNNTYTGTTTVQAGGVVVDGTQGSSNTIVNGGTLSGIGAVGAITACGGTLNSGDPQAPGTLTTTASIALASAAAFSVRLNGTTAGVTYDQLNVANAANLNSDAGIGSSLAVSVGFASQPGDTFTILTTTGGVSNTFQGLPEGAIFMVAGMNFQITYQANGGTAIVLTRVAGPVGAPMLPRQPPAATLAWAEGKDTWYTEHAGLSSGQGGTVTIGPPGQRAATDDYFTRVGSAKDGTGVLLFDTTLVTNSGRGNTLLGNHGGTSEVNLFYGLDPTLETNDYCAALAEPFVSC
jgi:autotransporter-associated beta strand protein